MKLPTTGGRHFPMKRTFNGKHYLSTGHNTRKSDAKRRAAYHRTQGRLARVTRLTAGAYWHHEPLRRDTYIVWGQCPTPVRRP